MEKPIIDIDNVVLPTDFVFNEIRKLNSIVSTGCKTTFNQDDNDTCRICCD